MADAWFNVPETTDAEGMTLPDIDESAIDQWWGNRLNVSPRYVIRIFGDQSALDAIAARPDADQLADQATAMNSLNTNSDATLTAESRLFD